MKWIKAADRLPTKAGPYFIRNKETYQKGICHFDEETGNFTWGTPFEWLDESPALVEDRADGWINVEDKAPELQQSVAFIVDSRPGSDYNGKVYGGKYLGYNFGEHEFVLPGICFSAKLWQPLPPPPNPTITKTP